MTRNASSPLPAFLSSSRSSSVTRGVQDRVRPAEPSFRFVWVRGQGDIGPPNPGVVVGWQYSPVHNANASDWIALVASCPFGSALLVAWTGSERLIWVRDPTPVDGPE